MPCPVAYLPLLPRLLVLMLLLLLLVLRLVLQLHALLAALLCWRELLTRKLLLVLPLATVSELPPACCSACSLLAAAASCSHRVQPREQAANVRAQSTPTTWACSKARCRA